MITLSIVNWCNELILCFGQLFGISAKQADTLLIFGILPTVVFFFLIGLIIARRTFPASKLAARICYYASSIILGITIALLIVAAIMTIGNLDDLIRESCASLRKENSSLKDLIRWLASEKKTLRIRFTERGRVVYGVLMLVVAGVQRSSLKRKIRII